MKRRLGIYDWRDAVCVAGLFISAAGIVLVMLPLVFIGGATTTVGGVL